MTGLGWLLFIELAWLLLFPRSFGKAWRGTWEKLKEGWKHGTP